MKYTFVFKETLSRRQIITEDTISVSCQSTFAHSTETFFDSSAPLYNFYPKVSIFDLQSNRRASTRVDLELSARYIEYGMSCFWNYRELQNLFYRCFDEDHLL